MFARFKSSKLDRLRPNLNGARMLDEAADHKEVSPHTGRRHAGWTRSRPQGCMALRISMLSIASSSIGARQRFFAAIDHPRFK